MSLLDFCLYSLICGAYLLLTVIKSNGYKKGPC